ncbi:hypothetical protein COLO4_00925, partial [Corchorus olitorius]
AARDGHFHAFAVLAVDDEREVGARFALADHVKGFGAVNAEREARGARLELQRQHAHADQVRAVNALEAFGHDGLNAGQAHALGGPVARAALAVVGAGNHDQRLFPVHVGFDRFPHARDLAFRLDARQRSLLHHAVHHSHLVDERRVGKRRALRGQVIAAVRGVRVEVLFRQAHLGEIFTGGTAGQDGVGRREVIGRDVVPQHRQRAQALERALAGQRAFPIGRAADVRALRAPVVQRAHVGNRRAALLEHRDVHLAELLGLDRCTHDGIDFFVGRPQVFQQDRLAVGIGAEAVALDIETHGARNRIGHHQWRRCEERLLGIRVDAAVKVAVARQHGRGVQVAVDDLLLDLRVQRAAHAVAGGAGKRDDAETELFQFVLEAGFFQIQLNGLGAWRQRAFHPRLAGQPQAVGIACQQRRGNHVARVAGVRAARDGRDDDRTIGHLARRFFPLGGDALGGQVGCCHTCVRVGRAGHVAHHAGQVEAQHAFVFGVLERVGPQAGGLGIRLDQLDLLVAAAGQAQ